MSLWRRGVRGSDGEARVKNENMWAAGGGKSIRWVWCWERRPLKGFGGANKAGRRFSESCRRRIARGELSFSFLGRGETGQLVLDFRKYGRAGVLPRSPLCHHYHPPSCCFMTISWPLFLSTPSLPECKILYNRRACWETRRASHLVYPCFPVFNMSSVALSENLIVLPGVSQCLGIGHWPCMRPAAAKSRSVGERLSAACCNAFLKWVERPSTA